MVDSMAMPAYCCLEDGGDFSLLASDAGGVEHALLLRAFWALVCFRKSFLPLFRASRSSFAAALSGNSLRHCASCSGCRIQHLFSQCLSELQRPHHLLSRRGWC